MKHLLQLYGVRFSQKTKKFIRVQQRKGPTQGVVQTGNKEERSTNAPLYEHIAQDRTDHCEEHSRVAAWKHAKNIFRIRDTYQENKNTIFKPNVDAVVLSRAMIMQEKRECTVGAGDLTPNKQETLVASQPFWLKNYHSNSWCLLTQG